LASSESPATPTERNRSTLTAAAHATGEIVTKKSTSLPPKLQAWVNARKRYRLTHAHVQMARELGMNPNKLGKLANHRQESWKAPLPEFIEDIYFKRFGRERPAVVVPIGQRSQPAAKKRKAKTMSGAAQRAVESPDGDTR
jgi:hypothetical protein